MITKMCKNNKDISILSEEEIKDMAKECVNEINIKEVYKEAKEIYNSVKDDEKYKDPDIKPIDD